METTCHQSPILLHPFGAATSNPEILHEAHGHLLSGHFGISKTNECLLQSYYWPNMESDIQNIGNASTNVRLPNGEKCHQSYL
jgi:hypothetical protein